MLKKLEELSAYIGNTPLKRLDCPGAELYAKLEYNNFSGSSKDRAAYSIMYNAVKSGKINKETTIIASSSGNLAISIASICKLLKVKFIPVIDPNINKEYEVLLNLLSYRIVKVTKRDETGGFLLTRIDAVAEMCSEIKNSYCADQYCDPNNYKGYYALGDEILAALSGLGYIFVAVSSGGAITGVSISVKAKRSDVMIIGVDVQGSVIFGQRPERRHISGIGSSQRSPIIEDAAIDDVIIVSQTDILKGCSELLNEQVIFGGASSGAVYFAAKKYFRKRSHKGNPQAALIFPDRGLAYLGTIYNPEWEQQFLHQLHQPA